MAKKEITKKEDLFVLLDLLDRLGMRYWVDGGWGVDILVGRQNREHRDLDINFDGQFTDILLAALEEIGYYITTDWRPCRMELYHPELGYIDIHPMVIADDGSAKQADLFGGWYKFAADYFTSAVFAGRTIPCISAKAQQIFHSGYELQEKDRFDMQNLNAHLAKGKQDLAGLFRKRLGTPGVEISEEAFCSSFGMKQFNREMVYYKLGDTVKRFAIARQQRKQDRIYGESFAFIPGDWKV